MAGIDKAISIILNEARRILENDNPTMEAVEYSAFLLNEALKLRQRYLGAWMPGERILADELSDECKEQQGGENEETTNFDKNKRDNRNRSFIDGKKVEDMTGIRFSHDYRENSGLPILQIDLKATNITLETKMLPALPSPFSEHYLAICSMLESQIIPNETVVALCKEQGIDLQLG